MKRKYSFYQQIWDVWEELDKCWKGGTYWIDFYRIEDTEKLIRGLKRHAKTGRTQLAVKALENYVSALKFVYCMWRDDYNKDLIHTLETPCWNERQESQYKLHNTLLAIKCNTYVAIISQDNHLGCSKEDIKKAVDIMRRKAEKKAV